MGTVYIFRGKAATGKSTLSDMLAKKLSIFVIRIDDIIDALKTTPDIDRSLVNHTIVFNILCKVIQTNLDLNVDFIIDVGLGDKSGAKNFYDRLDLFNHNIFSFYTICGDENEWKQRHIKRIENPTPNQSFKSFEHVLEHYQNFDTSLLDNEHIIDSACKLEECFDNIMKIINSRPE